MSDITIGEYVCNLPYDDLQTISGSSKAKAHVYYSGEEEILSAICCQICNKSNEKGTKGKAQETFIFFVQGCCEK